jgi:hypothetical protein
VARLGTAGFRKHLGSTHRSVTARSAMEQRSCMGYQDGIAPSLSWRDLVLGLRMQRLRFVGAVTVGVLLSVVACDDRKETAEEQFQNAVKNNFAQSEQADHETCSLLWDAVRKALDEARAADGSDKLWHAQLAQINLSVLLHRGCCRFGDTCPAYVHSE